MSEKIGETVFGYSDTEDYTWVRTYYTHNGKKYQTIIRDRGKKHNTKEDVAPLVTLSEEINAKIISLVESYSSGENTLLHVTIAC